MKWFLLTIFSLLSSEVFAASCCVSNTGVTNLMILPSKWQITTMASQSHVIGDVNAKGKSTFRSNKNKERLNAARLDVAYGWTFRYQTGISLRYQNRKREFNGIKESDSGWTDIGLSHSYSLLPLDRLWVFQTFNIPTATSVYDSKSAFAVDAHGTGTYQTSVGLFKIFNLKEWDFILSPEVHRSFSRTFKNSGNETEVKGAWGASLAMGTGYIPWKSKARYGLNLIPRWEGEKKVITNGQEVQGNRSLVWDTVFNWTYSFNAQYALGVNYLDQTLIGPVENTVLNRSLSLVLQARWL